MRRARILALLVLLVVLAAACGQKAGVGVQTTGDAFGTAPVEGAGGDAGAGGSGAGAGAGDGGLGTGDAPAGVDPAAPVDDGGTAPSAGGSPGGGGSDPATAAPAPGGGTSGGDPAAPPPAGDRTGVTDKAIKIGIHAPVSGAAPFPQTSFSQGADAYWKYLATKGGIFGRNVEVVFEDDQFNPASAKRVCQKMVEQDKVFLLIGGGGADQITACAQYANSVGVPYLSAGVNEQGLQGLRGYFAFSMTYSQQSPLLAQLAKNKLGGGKFAIAVADTPSFNDAFASIQKAAGQNGLEVVYQKRIPKDASQAAALGIANDLRTSGAEIVYFLSSPTTFINVASAGGGQGYIPQYIGPGVSSGLNTVARVGCPQIGEARFLSPFPQLDVIDQLDPEFRPNYRRHAGAEPDDIGLALWGLSKGLHRMFDAAGKDMTRQSFVQTLESGKTFATNIYAPVKYSSTNHFGANQAHLLRADCNARDYKTEAQFASGF